MRSVKKLSIKKAEVEWHYIVILAIFALLLVIVVFIIIQTSGRGFDIAQQISDLNPFS